MAKEVVLRSFEVIDRAPINHNTILDKFAPEEDDTDFEDSVTQLYSVDDRHKIQTLLASLFKYVRSEKSKTLRHSLYHVSTQYSATQHENDVPEKALEVKEHN